MTCIKPIWGKLYNISKKLQMKLATQTDISYFGTEQPNIIKMSSLL